MTTMTKADLIDNISSILELSKREAKQFVENFFAGVTHGLTHGHHVRLSGFGNFCLRDKAERPGRNPKTGEIIPVRARRVVTFKPGHKLRAKVGDILQDAQGSDDDGGFISTD